MIQVDGGWGGRGGDGRGCGRGGRGGGRSGGGRSGWGGRGAGGGYVGGGSRGSAGGGSRGGSRGHLGKGVYGSTTYGQVGPVGARGYNTSSIRNAQGRLMSLSRAYGPARADGGFGQVGTGRGSFRSSARRGSFGGPRGGGGSVSRFTAAVAPPSGGDGGGDDEPTTPPGSGRERSLRIRNSPARRTAFGRGRRAQGSRRSLRIGRSIGGLGSGGSRSGITV